jgi:hypothetical protein
MLLDGTLFSLILRVLSKVAMRSGISLALMCAIFFAGSCNRNVAPDSTVKESQVSSLQEEINSRRNLDETVWKKERLAQFYEQRIVRLWDELRQSRQKLKTLSSFPLERLDVPGKSSVEELANNIQSSIFFR